MRRSYEDIVAKRLLIMRNIALGTLLALLTALLVGMGVARADTGSADQETFNGMHLAAIFLVALLAAGAWVSVAYKPNPRPPRQPSYIPPMPEVKPSKKEPEIISFKLEVDTTQAMADIKALSEKIAEMHKACEGLHTPCKVDCPCWFDAQAAIAAESALATVDDDLDRLKKMYAEIDGHMAKDKAADTLRATIDRHSALDAARFLTTPSPAPLPGTAEYEDAVDRAAVTNFCGSMLRRLDKARESGKQGWWNPEVCSTENLGQLMYDAIGDGDTVDVANYLMMLHQRGVTNLSTLKGTTA